MTVTVRQYAHCRECDWVFDGPNPDKAAEKHTRTTGHATSSIMEPAP